jgi:hypothetical protein
VLEVLLHGEGRITVSFDSSGNPIASRFGPQIESSRSGEQRDSYSLITDTASHERSMQGDDDKFG